MSSFVLKGNYFALENTNPQLFQSMTSRPAAGARNSMPSAGGGADCSIARVSSDLADAPDEFKDMAFSCEVMDDPVIAEDGYTYNRSEIEEWFAKHATSPKTSAILQSKNLIPNRDLKSRIIEWKEEQQRLSQKSKQLFGSDIRFELLADSISVFDSDPPGYAARGVHVPAKLVYLKSSKTTSGASYACLRFVENDRATDIMLLPGAQCQLLKNSEGEAELIQLTLPRSSERYLQSASERYQQSRVTTRASESKFSLFGSAKSAANPKVESSRYCLFGSSARNDDYSALAEKSDSMRGPCILAPRTDPHAFTFTFKSSDNLNWYCLLTMCLQRSEVSLIEDGDDSEFVCPQLNYAGNRIEIKTTDFLHLLAPHEREGDAHGTSTTLANRIKQFLESFPQIFKISKDLLKLNFKITFQPHDVIILEGIILLPWLVKLMDIQQKQAKQACVVRFLKKYVVWRSKFASLFASRDGLEAWLPPQKLIQGALHLNCSHLNADIHQTFFFGCEAPRHESIKDSKFDRSWEQCRSLREQMPSLRLNANKHVRDVGLTINQVAAHSVVCRALPKVANIRFISDRARQFIAFGESASQSCKWEQRILAISDEHIFFLSPRSTASAGRDSDKACLPPLDVKQITPISSLQSINVSPFADDAIILHVCREPLISEPCSRETELDEHTSTCRGCGEKFPDFKIARAFSFGSGLRKTHCRGCGYVFCENCTRSKRCFPPFLSKQELQRCCKLCNSLLPVIPNQDVVLRDTDNIQILALILSLRPDIRVCCDNICEIRNETGHVRINFLPYDAAHRVTDDCVDSVVSSSQPIHVNVRALEPGCHPQVVSQKLQLNQLKVMYIFLRQSFETALPHILRTLMTLVETGSDRVFPTIQSAVATAMSSNERFDKQAREISRMQRQSVDESNEGFSRYISSVVEDLVRMKQHASSVQPSAQGKSASVSRFNPPDIRALASLTKRPSEATHGSDESSCAFNIPKLSVSQIEKFVKEEKKLNCSTPNGIMQCIALMQALLDGNSHFSDSGCSPVLFFGNTGVGKSTLVNMLLNKPMVSVKVGAFKCVAVAEGDVEASAIGHCKTQSATVKPISVLCDDGRLLLADFPGFEDTRGFAFNIANMANIKRFLGLFNTGARIVLLFEWNSLDTAKGKQVKDTCKLLERMFTRQNLPQVFDSILIAVTKVRGHVEQEEYDHNVQTFIVDFVNRAGWNLQVCDIKLVDPLKEHCGRISQSCQSNELRQSIMSLRPLQNGFSMFTPSLLSDDSKDLSAVHQHMEELILKNLESRSFAHVVQLVELLRSIMVLGQPTTQECMHRCMQSIIGSLRSTCSHLEVSVRLDATKKLSFRQDVMDFKEGCAHLENCFDDSFLPDQRPNAFFMRAKKCILSQEAEIQEAVFCRDICKPAEILLAYLNFSLQNLKGKSFDGNEAPRNNTAQLEAMQAICGLSDTHSNPAHALKICLKHLRACSDLHEVSTYVSELNDLLDGVTIEISNRNLVFCKPETVSLDTFLEATPTNCLKLIQTHVKNHLTILQENSFKSAMSSLGHSAPLIICSQSPALPALIDLFLGGTPRPFTISILKDKQYGFDVQSVIQVEAAVAYFEAVHAELDYAVVIQSFFAELESGCRAEGCRRLKTKLLNDIQAFVTPIHFEPKVRIVLEHFEQLRRLDPKNFQNEPSRKLLKEKLVDQPLKELQAAMSNPRPNYRDVVSNTLKVVDLLAELFVPKSSRADGRANQFNLPQVCLLMDEMRPLLDVRGKIRDFERERVKTKSAQWNAELSAAFRLFESESKAADSTREIFTLETSSDTRDVHVALDQATKLFCNLDSALSLSQKFHRIQEDRDNLLLCSSLDLQNAPEVKHFDEGVEHIAHDVLKVYRQTLSRLQFKYFKSVKKQMLLPLKNACFEIMKMNPTLSLDTPEKCKERMSMETQRELEPATRELESMKLGLIEEPFRNMAQSIYLKFMQSLSNEASRCGLEHVISSGKLSEHSAKLPLWMRSLESNGYSGLDRVRDNLLKSVQSVIEDKDAILSCIEAKQFKTLETLARNAQRLSCDLSSINMKVSTTVLSEVVTRRSQQLCDEAVREISDCFVAESPSDSGNAYKECELKNLENFMDCCHNVPPEIFDSKAFSSRILKHASEEFSTAMKRGQSDPTRIGPLIVKCFLVSSVAEISQEKIVNSCNELIANAGEDHRQAAVDYLSRCKSVLVVGAYASQAFEKLLVLREKELEKLNSKTGFMKDTMVVAKMDPKPKVGDNTLLELSSMMQREWNQHIENFVTSQRRPFDLSAIQTRVQVMSEEVKSVLNQGKSLFICREKVASILAAIFAAWTILYFQKSGGNEAKIEPNSLIRPHDTQKIAILRLIGVDVQQPPRNHLIQVRTGEGKSISLGVTSTFYAIMEQTVHVPCYSPYLSLRDQREFSPLFKLFDVEEKILYCTFTELAHNLMSLGSIVDYRNVATGVLTNATVKPVSSPVKHLIIFDEVDVFWGQDFFGQCYRAVHVIDCKHAQDMVKYVWQHRSSLAKNQSSIDKIMNEPFTIELLRMYPLLKQFLPFEIGKMLEDVDFVNHENPVAVKPNAIGYVDTSKGAICTETTFGYRTAFAYLNFCENGDLEYSARNNKVGVRVFCGSHLYSELPKIATRILGLSATIPSQKSEYDRILGPYDLTGQVNRTIMPSTFDKKEPRVCDPIIWDTVDEFYEDLKNEIKAVLNRKRPTLVFFEDQKRLFEFKNHLEARSIVSVNYRRFEYLTNETPLVDRDDIISRAGDRCAITLLTRSYGRGTDFKCLHPDVDREGGVHVILTFPPESESELTQIRGRTCRQDCNGSFRLMLCQVYLEGEHKFTKDQSIEDFLAGLRDNFEKQRVDDMFQKLQNHEPQCLLSRGMAKAAERDPLQAQKILFELQGYGSQPFSAAQSIEVAFLFDATKSMGPYIHAAKERVMNIANDVKRGVAAANPKISAKDLESFVKFAFVGYRDWNASGTVYDAPGQVESFDLSSDIKSLKLFIEQVKPHGGGDLAEDVAGGLRAIESLKWSPASAKCVFMLADAPCHGKQYHSLEDSSHSSSLFNIAAGKTRFDASVARDEYHNVVGSQYDLSPDGAFNGHTIAVYQAYTGEGFTFQEPKAALEKKGFTVILWHGQLPPVDEFQSALDSSCQLWLISGQTVTLSEAHIQAVLRFVEARKGLFLWGDNDPYHADANAIISRLPFFNSTVSLAGNFYADKIIAEHTDPENMRAHGPHGFKPHYITTGLESLYEGITISDIRDPQELCEPIITCSDGRSHVTCLYSKDKYRVLIDGGFTRLYPDRWARTAGTARFVTNAACFLAAFEDKADHFPGGDPRGAVPERQIESLVAAHNIKFFFVNICREKTDQMVGVWNRHLDSKKLRAIDTSLHLGQSESDSNIMDRFAAQISRAILADFTSPTSRK